MNPRHGSQDIATNSAKNLWSKLSLMNVTMDKFIPQKKGWRVAFAFLAFLVLFYSAIFILCAIEGDRGHKYHFKPVKPKHQDYDTVHLATVCGGYRASRDFYTLLKSILFHRRAYEIHYHLFLDNISMKILKKLFNTWRVPDFKLSFYNVTEYESDVAWIPNSHYSNRYGLLKLMIPSILATKKVDKVILLDTDMVSMGDVKLIWKKFSDFVGERSFLGLVENQSDWYLSRKESSKQMRRPIVWPAIGRGFNTGMMLVDVNKAMRNDWDKIWREIAETELVDLLSTSLADQDIYNAVIKKHSDIVTKLPCHLNLQINNHTEVYDTCFDYQTQEIIIVHWNTPQKLNTDNSLAEYFKGWYTTFQDWNGKLLEQNGRPYSFNRSVKSFHRFLHFIHSFDAADDLCFNFHPKPDERLRTFLYYSDFEFEPQTEAELSLNGITAVVHLSMDRFQSLEDLAARWSGPISAAIYLSDAETSLLVNYIEISHTLSTRKNIAYHLVFSVFGWHYPINRLRNIALENAITPYVFLSDIDFLPSNGLHTYLQRTIKQMKADKDQALDKIALVIPAFEDGQYKLVPPQTKIELMNQLDIGNIKTFRAKEWPQGQEQTDYAKWRKATQPYTVTWKTNYEPFIVTSRNVSKFDERFIGFGWNKVEHDMSLAAQGYEFIVLPEAFMVHQGHTASREIKDYRQHRNFHRCINQLKNDVIDNLKLRFNFSSLL